ncbi:hypothetical protein D3C73_1511720 [compost metagenome]
MGWYHGFHDVLACGQRGGLRQVDIRRDAIEILQHVVGGDQRIDAAVFHLHRQVVFIMHDLRIEQLLAGLNA